MSQMLKLNKSIQCFDVVKMAALTVHMFLRVEVGNANGGGRASTRVSQCMQDRMCWVGQQRVAGDSLPTRYCLICKNQFTMQV